MRVDRQRAEQIYLWLIVAVGAALRVAELWAPFTHDELSAILRLRFDTFHDLLQGGVRPDGHPAGMQVLLWLWSHVVGTSAPLLRLPFLLLGIGSIPLMYSVTRRWYGHHAAMFAATLLALSQYTVYYSMPVRPYGTGLFCILLLLHFWTRILVERRWHWLELTGFAVCAALCAYMHYFCAFTAALLAVAGFLFVERKMLWKYILVCVSAVLLFLPHLELTLHHLFDLKGVGGWLGVPDISFFCRYLRYLTHHSWMVLILVTVGYAVMFDHTVWCCRRKLILIGMTLFLLPIVAGYIYSRQVNPVLQYSVLIFSYPFLLLTLSGMVGERYAWRTDAVVALCGVGLLLSLFVNRRHYDVIHREYIPATVEMAEDAQRRFGNDNVALLLEIDTQMLAWYDTAVAASVSSIDMIDSLDAEYVVASRLSDAQMLDVQKHWPYLLETRQCTGSNLFLLSRRPEGAISKDIRVVAEGTVSADAEYTMLLDTVVDAFSDNRHVLVTSMVHGIDSNYTLVMETYVGKRRVDWHGVDAKDSVCLPLSLNLCVKSQLSFERARVKIYLWRHSGESTGPAYYRITASEGNQYIYSLLEEI